MRRASTVQNLLIAILLAARAGTAYAAEGPFIPIDLGSLGGNSRALAVHDGAQVVAGSIPTGDVARQASAWTPAGGMIELGTLGGSGSFARAVNASGQVVGFSRLASLTSTRAFSWTPAEGIIDLGTL